jgi:hypothetical protein
MPCGVSMGAQRVQKRIGPAACDPELRGGPGTGQNWVVCRESPYRRVGACRAGWSCPSLRVMIRPSLPSRHRPAEHLANATPPSKTPNRFANEAATRAIPDSAETTRLCRPSNASTLPATPLRG